MPYDANNDFNGDSISDVLWMNPFTGTLTNWLGHGDGTFGSNFGNSTNHWSFPWLLRGAGDYNGDGRDDVLWVNDQTGQVTNWLAQSNGGFANNQSFSGQVGVSWYVEGVGDFNGDTRDDVLWRNSETGQVTNWLGQTSGSFVSNFANADHDAGEYWHVAGVGDFDGDGLDDVLWRHRDGNLFNWLGQSDGSFVSNSTTWDAFVPIGWAIVGIGDFNGDNRDDILWRNFDDGLVTNWLGQPDGRFVGNFEHCTNYISPEWRATGVGDYNGDHQDDILWINQQGDVSNWLALEDSSGGFQSNFANFYGHVGQVDGDYWMTYPPATVA